MALLLQVLGVLAAGLIVSAVFRARSDRSWLDPRAVAVVAAVTGALLFWANVWGAAKTFVDERRDLAGLSRADATNALGIADGQNVAFLSWAKRHMGREDTFAVLPADLATRVENFIPYQWSVFQLSPHRSVSEEEGDWLVFYGVSPDAVSYDEARFDAPLKYSPTFALARRSDAG